MSRIGNPRRGFSVVAYNKQKRDRQRRTGLSELLLQIENLEQTAHRLGAHTTAHALNNAKNALGWELAGNVPKAGAAARGETWGKR